MISIWLFFPENVTSMTGHYLYLIFCQDEHGVVDKKDIETGRKMQLSYANTSYPQLRGITLVSPYQTVFTLLCLGFNYHLLLNQQAFIHVYYY
jgi:hypothetical protein